MRPATLGDLARGGKLLWAYRCVCDRERVGVRLAESRCATPNCILAGSWPCASGGVANSISNSVLPFPF